VRGADLLDRFPREDRVGAHSQELVARVAERRAGSLVEVEQPVLLHVDEEEHVGRSVERRAEALQRGLAALPGGDVAAHAAVADEVPVRVVYRLAADRKPHAAAALDLALHLEIAERLAPLELGAVALPVGLGRVERRQVPALAAR
jgi:hypothetical protein